MAVIQDQVYNFAVIATYLLPTFLNCWKLYGNQDKIDERQKTIEILRSGLNVALSFILVLTLLLVFVLWLFFGRISKESESMMKLSSNQGVNLIYWLIGVLVFGNFIQLCYIFYIKITIAKRE